MAEVMASEGTDGSAEDGAGPAPSTVALEGAFDAFVREIDSCAEFVRGHPFYGDPENRPDAYAFLIRMILARIEEDVIFDADFPAFRVIDPRTPDGAANPDQRYLIASVRGGETYRIWGALGSVRRLEVQIYAGYPFIEGTGGRSASFLAFEDITFEPDGTFEVFASPERRAGNWLENPSDATLLIVRQIHSDWGEELPRGVHIDRVGAEGALRPALTEEAMTRRLRKATANLGSHTRAYPHMVQRHYLDVCAPNEVSAPLEPSSLGGVAGRWSSHGVFELADHEALIVSVWPADGNYQGIQLADLWFATLEYANRQTSLTADQAHRSSDGSYRFVISAQDPGVRNWLDTCGRGKGVFMLRYDGTRQRTFDPERYPTAVRVPLADLHDHLPADTPLVAPAERASDIADRRRHVQRRYGI